MASIVFRLVGCESMAVVEGVQFLGQIEEMLMATTKKFYGERKAG